MYKEYRDVRFKTDEQFMKYHTEQAEKGDYKSQCILSTLSRVWQAKRFWKRHRPQSQK